MANDQHTLEERDAANRQVIEYVTELLTLSHNTIVGIDTEEALTDELVDNYEKQAAEVTRKYGPDVCFRTVKQVHSLLSVILGASLALADEEAEAALDAALEDLVAEDDAN